MTFRIVNLRGVSLAALLALTAAAARADHVVFDNVGAGGLPGNGFYSGPGAFSAYNLSDGDPALGTYHGNSPTFEFVPTNVQAGESLTGFKVGVGNGPVAGIYDFHLTLFTSGASHQTDSSLWTRLGSWTGHTNGQPNAGQDSFDPSNLVSVAASPITLANNEHYYLMATADANQGLDDSSFQHDLWWAYGPVHGYHWEPTEITGRFESGFDNPTGVFQVVVGAGSAAATPEPISALSLGGLLLVSGVSMCRKRRSSGQRPDLSRHCLRRR